MSFRPPGGASSIPRGVYLLDIVNSSLLLPLILDFLKERRHRRESEDFCEFKAWLYENIERLVSESEGLFDVIRKSQDVHEEKLNEILKKLDVIATDISGPSIDQLYSALDAGERTLLEQMFLLIVEEPGSNGQVDLNSYSPDAQRLEELGLAQVHESSASYGASLTDAGAVLGWSLFDAETLTLFEEALETRLTDRSYTMRLGSLTDGLNISDSLALHYMRLLAHSGFLSLEDNTWPPSQALIWNATESFVRSPPRAADLVKLRLSEYKRMWTATSQK